MAGRWDDEAELTAKAQGLRTELALEALLVTRSEEGMSLYTAEGSRHVPAQAREVFDVSGAGDTVIATTGVLMGAGADLATAMAIANRPPASSSASSAPPSSRPTSSIDAG